MLKVKNGSCIAPLLAGLNSGVSNTPYNQAFSRTLFDSGKSLEIIPLGVTHVRIGDDHYKW